MKLKDVRKSAIKYCEENNCKYTYISYNDNCKYTYSSRNDIEDFYLTDREDEHTVFLVNRNGSLDAYLNTNYATEFHKELKRRRNKRQNGENNKRKSADMCNREFVEDFDNQNN